MILSTIRMMIPPQKRNEALKILRSITDQCSDYHGCLSCHIYEDLQEKNILMFEQAWRADEDLDLHIRSDEYLNLLLVLEMALQTARDQVRQDSAFDGNRDHRKGKNSRKMKLLN